MSVTASVKTTENITNPALIPFAIPENKIEKLAVSLIGAGSLGTGAAGSALLFKAAGALAISGTVFWPLLVFFGICAIALTVGLLVYSKLQKLKSAVPTLPSYEQVVSNPPSRHQFSFSAAIQNSGDLIIKPKRLSSSSMINTAWYLAWRLQPTDIPPIPEDVDLINLFVGQLDPVNGVSGLQGPFSTAAGLQSFTARCHAEDIPVMVSVGGHGGNYDNTWDQLTAENIPQYAQALANFCKTNNVDGIDFDWEPDNWTQAQGNLVGQLIQQFKALSSSSESSLCVNSAISWETDASWVLAGAQNEGGLNTVDRVNIMAYYPASEMEPYISGPGGWEDWAKQFNPAPQITVGMLSNAPDLQSFSEFDYSQGLSTGLWYYDPANPSGSNAADATPWNIYHQNSEGIVPRE